MSNTQFELPSVRGTLKDWMGIRSPIFQPKRSAIAAPTIAPVRVRSIASTAPGEVVISGKFPNIARTSTPNAARMFPGFWYVPTTNEKGDTRATPSSAAMRLRCAIGRGCPKFARLETRSRLTFIRSKTELSPELTPCSTPNRKNAVTTDSSVSVVRTGRRHRPAQMRGKYFMRTPAFPAPRYVPCRRAACGRHTGPPADRGSPSRSTSRVDHSTSAAD